MIDRLRASDPFADEAQFGQIDLSGCPSFFEAELAEKENKKDPFEPADYSGENKHGLQDFLRGIDSDNDAIESAARMAGADPSVIADHLDRVAQQIGIDFKKAVGKRYVQCDENLVAMVDWLCEKSLHYTPDQDVEENITLLQREGFWSKDNLLSAFYSLWESGTLPVYPSGVWVPMTEQQHEFFVRTAATGNWQQAIIFGLKSALRLRNTSDLVIDVIIADPQYRVLLDQLTMLAFVSSESGFDSRVQEEFNEFASQWAGDRPYTLRMLAEAYQAFQKEKRSVRDNQEPEPQEFEPQDFDRLSDSELESLRVAVLRERAKSR